MFAKIFEARMFLMAVDTLSANFEMLPKNELLAF